LVPKASGRARRSVLESALSKRSAPKGAVEDVTDGLLIKWSRRSKSLDLFGGYY
jgi:hypothetical protein